MSAWNHLVCDFCWLVLNPGREPVRALNRDEEDEIEKSPCCKCGALTDSGIYVRGEPNSYEHCDEGAHA